MSEGERRTRMTTREGVLWSVVGLVAVGAVVWLTWSPTLAAVAVVATVAVVGAETWGHRQLEKRDKRRSQPPGGGGLSE
jgi:fatty acid desaturase